MTPGPIATTRVSVEPERSKHKASYEVVIGSGQLNAELCELGVLLQRPAGRAFLVIDAGVPDHVSDRVIETLHIERWNVATTTITPSESIKTIETVHRLLAAMEAHRLERGEPVIALGGGVVGDISGFAASCYRRGVPIVQCPTTLLAMVDASVGGKTGVNLALPNSTNGNLVKNAVGAFHQPTAVIADVSTLESLDESDFRAGLAECYKHAMIGADWDDADLRTWMLSMVEAIDARDHATLSMLVNRCVTMKGRVVAADERETQADGGRVMLNLGHTFAHAIEPLAGLKKISPNGETVGEEKLRHGEAVALGLVAATASASFMGLCDPVLVDHVRRDLAKLKLPTAIAGLPSDEELRQAMSHDKKASAGAARLILPTKSGHAVVVDDPPTSVIDAGWHSIRAVKL